MAAPACALISISLYPAARMPPAADGVVRPSDISCDVSSQAPSRGETEDRWWASSGTQTPDNRTSSPTLNPSLTQQGRYPSPGRLRNIVQGMMPSLQGLDELAHHVKLQAPDPNTGLAMQRFQDAVREMLDQKDHTTAMLMQKEETMSHKHQRRIRSAPQG